MKRLPHYRILYVSAAYVAALKDYSFSRPTLIGGLADTGRRWRTNICCRDPSKKPVWVVCEYGPPIPDSNPRQAAEGWYSHSVICYWPVEPTSLAMPEEKYEFPNMCEAMGDGLTKLYFQVYPEHDGAHLHFFMGGYGFTMVLNADDIKKNERAHYEAQKFLLARLWEKNTGHKIG